MDSSATLSKPKDSESNFPVTKYFSNSSRRTPSFSSSSSLSSCSSYFPDDSPLSNANATPLRFFGKPFSWEHLPGIPKKSENHKKKESSQLLPLMPPPATQPAGSKKHHFEDTGNSKGKICSESFRMDPFFAALVECSKDDDDHHHHQESTSSSSIWNGSAKVSRSISDRFGFVNLYASCKRTSAVSESIVYLPRSNRASYDLVNRHRS